MTNEEKKEVAKMFMVTAKLYDRDIGADVALLIVEDLEDLGFEKIKNALSVYRKDSKNKFWPKASDIRNIINPQINSKEFAITLARKIDATISKYGWNWEHGQFINGEKYYYGGGKYHWTFKEAVIAELGELGWHSICSRGGWLNVRNSANEMDEGQFIPQLVGQIESSFNLQKQGIDITLIEMPKPAIIEYEQNKIISDELNIKRLSNNLKEIPK